MRAFLASVSFLFACAPAAVADDGLSRAVGKALFERDWVPAPASTASTDGLGPYHDARSCAACHPGAGPARLRADVTTGELGGLGLILRLAGPSGGPDPAYGRQLQRQAVPTLAPEGAWRLLLTGESTPPTVAIDGLTGVSLASSPSPRVAPDLRGLGGLELVPDEAVLARADPDDSDGDGISGRPNRDPRTGRVGRFGLKAAVPDLAAQTATAFLLDLGLATPGLPAPAGDCTPTQAACLAAPQGATAGSAELPAAVVDAVAAFLHGLRAPPPPGELAGGRGLFEATGCASCHAVELPTGRGAVPAGTDLLLHDLGPGLADGVAEGEASGSEWRTAPLAGIGRRLAAGTKLLHDGRAAGVPEAVAWHDGEAAAARARFEGLAGAERDALVGWLEAWR